MTNSILLERPDKSIALAIKKALLDGEIHRSEFIDIVASALDDGGVTDIEYRDLKRFMRTQPGISEYFLKKINDFLDIHYPLEPIGPYPGDIDRLEGTRKKGDHQCAALVQHSQPAGMARSWRQGIAVRGNLTIKKGTPIATFEDGFYSNRKHDNHVAYYISQNKKGLKIMDQWGGDNKPKVSSRTLEWLGKKSSGFFIDPSNNGDAFSVIMRKKSLT